MTERQAALTTMHEFTLRLKGKEKEEQKRFEVARWLAWRLMVPYYKQGQTPSTARQYFPFPWDPGRITTEEQAREALERSRVTEEETAVLNKVFEELNRKLQR